MFYIAEAESQLTVLGNYRDVYIDVIQGNDSYHPKLSPIVAVYIRPLLADKGFIIPIAHSEGLNVSLEQVRSIIEGYETVYVLDKKFFLYHFMHSNVQDVRLMHSLKTFSELTLPQIPKTILQFYRKYGAAKTLNSIIPITWLYGHCELRYNKAAEIMEQCLDMVDEPSWKFYNNTAVGVFFFAEQSGLRVTVPEYLENFKPKNPKFNMEDNLVYTYYNMYNNTSRPTNAFNSVNFAAIPKTPQHRECIIPKNDSFVEIDFDGYHVRLLAEVVGYEFTPESVHLQLGREYFNTDTLTEEQYEMSKKNTFQQMYGGVEERYRYIEFFDKVVELKNKLWKDYTEKGYAVAPISGKKFSNRLKDMHALKLMNYIVQNLETSRNILILKEVLKFLRDKKTTIALYTYDAILFDVSESDNNVVEELQRIMSEDGKYPVKTKQNTTLVL